MVAKFKIKEDEFLEAIKSSSSHDQASKKLGYRGTRVSTLSSTLYAKLFRKLKPDISHFSTLSKRKERLTNKVELNIELELLFNITNRQAKYKSREFNLSFDDFKIIVTSVCNYCGSDGDIKSRTNYKNRKFSRKFCGIDRIDSSKGYTIDNVVPCCFLCNRMKSNIDLSIFLQHIKDIYIYNYLGE